MVNFQGMIMASKKDIEKMSAALKSDSLSMLGEHDVAIAKEGMPSNSVTSMSSPDDASSCVKVSNGSTTQLDESGYVHTDGSHMGIQMPDGSIFYLMPRYNPCPLMRVDGQGVGQQPYFTSSGCPQLPVFYRSEAMPCYSWDSTYVGGDQYEIDAGFESAKQGSDATAFANSNGLNPMKANADSGSEFSESLHTQPVGSPSQVPPSSSASSAVSGREYHPLGKFSSTIRRQDLVLSNVSMNDRRNGRSWNGNDRCKFREKSNENENFEKASELTLGPRAYNRIPPEDSFAKKEQLGLRVCRDQYNLLDFQTDFENAKFYVIKSYNEDDIHKSIKYDVWSSTPNGNRKLDAAFHEVEVRAAKTGKKCPVFLFFSVNGSGQFVGLAEMIGPVDFNKDMDFWKIDKWTGFFPVKWHVIKDIPNSTLRHIILENNYNRPVTFCRDSQEVRQKPGLEMLKIFKNFSAKTSLLDDFNFFEDREKSQRSGKGNKPTALRMEGYEEGDIKNHRKAEGINLKEAMRTEIINTPGSLMCLTKNLSVHDRPRKSHGVKKPI